MAEGEEGRGAVGRRARAAEGAWAVRFHAAPRGRMARMGGGEVDGGRLRGMGRLLRGFFISWEGRARFVEGSSGARQREARSR